MQLALNPALHKIHKFRMDLCIKINTISNNEDERESLENRRMNNVQIL